MATADDPLLEAWALSETKQPGKLPVVRILDEVTGEPGGMEAMKPTWPHGEVPFLIPTMGEVREVGHLEHLGGALTVTTEGALYAYDAIAEVTAAGWRVD